MLQYLLKRLLAMIPTLLGITFVTFCIVNFAPGDPVAASMGKGAAGSGDAGGDGGGGGGQDRKLDAIKAKKKLLGMLEDDPVVRVWDAREAAAPETRDAVKASGRPAELMQEGSFGPLPRFARTLAWSDATKRLHVGAEGGLVHVADPATDEVLSTLTTGLGDLWSTAVDAEGRTLAVGDTRGAFGLFAVTGGEPLGERLDFGKPLRRIVALADGSFVSACDDGVIRVHAPGSGKVSRELRGPSSSYVSGLAVSADGARLWSAGYDRRIREWDLASGRLVREVGEAGQAVAALALSPDGGTLAAAAEDRIVTLWNLRAGGEPRKLQGHYKGVTSVAWSADGRLLWTGGRDGTVRAWDVASGVQTAQTAEDQGIVTAIVPAPGGAAVWTASESLRKTPVTRRYVKWLGRTAMLDFDRSFVDDEKVMTKIGESIPVTLGMNVLAILVTYLIAIPWGILAAVRRGKAFDHFSSVVLFMLWSLPSFWVATMLIMWFSSKRNLDLFPSVGLHSTTADRLAYLPWLADWGAHLVLPLIVMVYASFTGLAQYMRTSMLETISQDFVRTARAKGLSERVVIYKHALRNSLITMVTLLAGLLPGMIGGSLFVEIIFSINGMGRLSYTAVLSRDYPVIMAITTITAFMTLLGVLVSDLLYGVVDPRIRNE